MTTPNTRETWLNNAADLLFAMLLDGIAESNGIVKHGYRLSVGAIVGNAKAIGCCFPRSRSDDGVNEIFFTPSENNSSEILATMVHELIHALDDNQSGHKGVFAKMARQCDLVGRLTATTAGETLQATINDILDVLGDIPHSKLNTAPLKKQGTRSLLLKCECCGFQVRITKKHYDAINFFDCLSCDNGTLNLEVK